MARLPRQGVALASLNEKKTTLSEVISALGFRKLRRMEEQSAREALGFSIGAWQTSGSKGASPVSTIEEVDELCSRIGAQLTNACGVLGAVHEGFQNDLFIDVTAHIAQSLAKSTATKSIQGGYDAIKAFLSHARPIAASALLAAEDVRAKRLRRGRDRQEWYARFVDVVAVLCASNGVKPTLSTDSKKDQPGGRFLEALEAFEGLLPKGMQSPSRAARLLRFRRWRQQRPGPLRTKTSSA